MNIDTLSDRLRHLAALKAEKKRLAEETRENSARIDEQEREITSAMLDMAEKAGLDKPDAFTVTVDGRRYGISVKPFYSIPAEKRDEAFRTLRDLGLGDLIVERVDDRSLTKVLTELAADADGELPEPYRAIPTRFYEKTTITDRRVSA